MIEANYAEELTTTHPSRSHSTSKPPFSSTQLSNFNYSGYPLNHSENEEELVQDNWLRHSLGVTALLCVGYTVVFVLGILGNTMVVNVVARSPRMRTVTNYFIVNLALADILVLLFCLPATLVGNIINSWILGLFMCKAVSYLQGVSVSASINTLVAISIDRFVAICFPLRCQMSTSIARRIIVIVWLFSTLISIPWIIFFEIFEEKGHTYCVESWPHPYWEKVYFLAANVTLCYVVPLCAIVVCYAGIWLKVWRRSIPGETTGTNAHHLVHKSKLKVVKMMVIVVVLFVLSWLPLYVIFAIIKLEVSMEEGSSRERILNIMVPIAQWLGASNSCINPLLYTFYNKKFRKGFVAVIKSRSCCAPLRYDAANKSTTKSTELRSTYKSHSRCDVTTDCATTSLV